MDCFAGAAGGWSLGLHRAGYRTVAACEIDPWRRAAFLSNFPAVEMWDDIRAVSARSIRDRLGYLPDIIVGSPPCKDISSANPNGVGLDGEHSGLFWGFVRVVGECRPVWFAAENSPLTRVRGYDRLAHELEAHGYACWPLVVGADDIGAPHVRKRMWLVGVRTDHSHPDQWRERQGAAWGEDRRGQLGETTPAGSGPAADAERVKLRQQPGRGGGTHGTGAAFDRLDDPERLAAGSSWPSPGDGGAGRWPDWHARAVRHLRAADGLPERLAREGACAYGDAVVPQITEAIGRAMTSLMPVGEPT